MENVTTDASGYRLLSPVNPNIMKNQTARGCVLPHVMGAKMGTFRKTSTPKNNLVVSLEGGDEGTY